MINMRAKETQISLELRKKEKRIWSRAEKNELKSRRIRGPCLEIARRPLWPRDSVPR